jgi:dienelactone hydrolase
MKLLSYSCFLLFSLLILSCNNDSKLDQSPDAIQADTPRLKEESVSYSFDTVKMEGYMVYNESRRNQLPVVLVVHEWWGLNDYVKSRARQLAEMGYLAFAVDMYGHGKTAANPTEAKKLAMPFYLNPQLAEDRLVAALQKAKSHQAADTTRTAAIGYCYGGYVVLNAAKLGADLDGVVSFHGNLVGAPVNRDTLKAEVLVCHGAADKYVSENEVNAFKKSMDSIATLLKCIPAPRMPLPILQQQQQVSNSKWI